MSRETDFTTSDALTFYQVVRRLSDGQYQNGGAFEAFNAAHWTSYAQPLTGVTLSATHLANYSANLVAPAGRYKVEIYQQAAGTPSITADGTPTANSYVIVWDGTRQVPPAILFDASGNVLANSQVTVVTSGTAASSSAVPVAQDFTIAASNYWSVAFEAEGLDSTGWTEMVFTVKRDPDSDQDSESLVQVKLTNPGAGGDGLLIVNAATATDATQGSIAVTSISPNTNITVTLKAPALLIPPSGNTDYTWELTRYITAARKERIGTGNLTVERGVMRSITAP